jgi:predicted transcriptional regulator
MKTTPHGELELQVMDILWQNEKSSISEVFKEINKSRNIAYTTVATILQRLYDKGLVDRNEESNHYIYVPKLSKKDYSSKLVKTFINKLVNNFGDIAITSFAESIENLPEEKKQYLLQQLQEYENK